MRLCEFRIRNFKNLEDITFIWDDIIVLIGENNTGKSSVLQALDWFLCGRQIDDKMLFRNGNTENPIELIGTFDELSESDSVQKAVQGRTHDGKWILKKEYSFNTEKNKFESQYYSYGEVEVFQGWPEADNTWSNFPSQYQEIVSTHGIGGRATNTAKEQLRQMVRDEAPELVEKKADWIPDPGGGGGWKSNANSIIPRFIMVRAVYDASTESKSKERQSLTTYGEILTLVLEKRLLLKPEIKELKIALAKVRSLFQPDPAHTEWEIAEEIKEFESRLSELLSKVITSKAKLIPSDVSVEDILVPSTRLRVDDGFETEIEGQGHGLQRTLIMSLLQILVEYENLPENSGDAEEGCKTSLFRRKTIFAIEEPELYMHPQMERKVHDTLYELAQSEDYQVICSTHSPVFLDMAEKHRAIVRLEAKADRSIVRKQVNEDIFTGDDAHNKKNRLRMITEFDPSVNELFFAKRVVLVEGDTEMAVFRRAAELLGLFEERPHARRDTTFINCHGKWTIVLFLQVLNHFDVEYLVFHDEDRSKLGLMSNERIAELVKAPNQLRMFSPESIESLLGYDASTKDKPIKALLRLEELASVEGIPSEFEDYVRLAWGC